MVSVPIIKTNVKEAHMKTLRIKDWHEIPIDYTGIVEMVDGSKHWYLDGKRHREGGPAVEHSNGEKHWYLNGSLHREDGPASEFDDNNKAWHLNGMWHRVDGPAIDYENKKEWWLNDQLHREDGPAIEYQYGAKGWYLNGKCLFWLLSISQPFVLLEEFVDEEGEGQIKVLAQAGIETWKTLPGLKELADNWEKK
jgi:hypothetical protein